MSKVQEGHKVNPDDGLNRHLYYLGNISTVPSTGRMPQHVVLNGGLCIMILICNLLNNTGVVPSPGWEMPSNFCLN
eukprot:5339929-Ditylum_brightwellii.AAC.1